MNTVIFKVVHFQCNYIISEFFHFAVRFRSVTLYKFDLESLSLAFLRTFQVEDKELSKDIVTAFPSEINLSKI